MLVLEFGGRYHVTIKSGFDLSNISYAESNGGIFILIAVYFYLKHKDKPVDKRSASDLCSRIRTASDL
jgi:cystathionine beta-lyase/cystathionine gamma-synthase